jgi:hypothetical protein
MKKIDRSQWPSGEWDSEPDRLEWRVGDYFCLISRVGHSGFLCGYVGVGKGHRWYGVDYDALYTTEPDLNVHGGLTFAGPGAEAVADRWLMGFDCGHSGDLSPAILGLLGRGPNDWEQYRNLNYVRGEVNRLLAAAGGSYDGSTGNSLWIEDGDVVRLRSGTVTGDGAELLRRWIRFGDSRLDIAADWIEDHPEFVEGMSSRQVSEAAAMLRRQVMVS